MTMTKDEVLAFIEEQKKIGRSFPQIEELLKAKGYVSPRTGKTPGYMAIRAMYLKDQKKAQKEVRAIEVSSPSSEYLSTLKALLDVAIPETQKCQIIDSYVRNFNRAGKPA